MKLPVSIVGGGPAVSILSPRVHGIAIANPAFSRKMLLGLVAS